MNPIASGFIVGASIALLILGAQHLRDSWREIGARLDRDMAEMVNGPARTATSCDLGYHDGPWSRYSTYGIWLCCGQREDQPYDQEMTQ